MRSFGWSASFYVFSRGQRHPTTVISKTTSTTSAKPTTTTIRRIDTKRKHFIKNQNTCQGKDTIYVYTDASKRNFLQAVSICIKDLCEQREQQNYSNNFHDDFVLKCEKPQCISRVYMLMYSKTISPLQRENVNSVTQPQFSQNENRFGYEGQSRGLQAALAENGMPCRMFAKAAFRLLFQLFIN